MLGRGEDVDLLVGSLGGVDVWLRGSRYVPGEVALVLGRAKVEVVVGQRELGSLDPSKLVQRLERALERIPEAAAEQRALMASQSREAEQAKSRLGQPFADQEALDTAVGELASLDEELSAHHLEAAVVEPKALKSVTTRLAALKAPSPGQDR